MRSETFQISWHKLFVFATVLSLSALAGAQRYQQTNLVSDVDEINGVPTNHTQPLDPQLVNPWGLAASASSPLWVSDNGAVRFDALSRHGRKSLTGGHHTACRAGSSHRHGL